MAGIGGSIIGALTAFLSAVARFFGSLFQAEANIVTHLHSIVDDFKELKMNVEKQTKQLKEHKFDPKWRTRVISPPKAIEHFIKIIDFMSKDWKDRIDKLVEPIHDLERIFHAENSSAGDPQGAASGLVKSAVKVDEIATMIEQVAKAMTVVKEIDNMFQTILNDIFKLEGLFLPQSRAPKTVQARFHYRTRVQVQPKNIEIDKPGTQSRLNIALLDVKELQALLALVESQLGARASRAGKPIVKP